ncbi:MAG TPA: RNA polymerase sigma factor [Deltaproteobacteria bacterium]|nr:RNA polymerase sigma factor [Deltaproteobacteria bacterium]
MRYNKTVYDIESFFEANKNRLFAYLVRMTGNADEALDILQESIMRYMEHYRAEENPGALLFTIARNALIDSRRRRLRIVQLDDDHKDSRTGQEHSLMVKDSCRRVLSGFKRLGQEERDILAMVVSSDLSYQEIAAIQGLSVSNVKVKVHRARLKLKKIFEGEE